MASKAGTSSKNSLTSDSTNRSSSPTQSRAMEELRRQLLKAKGELEAEKQKSRQLIRNHNKDLKSKKEELEKKHKQQLEQAVSRKDQEKRNELKLTEERLIKQKDLEVKKLLREKKDEIKEVKTRLSLEYEEKMKSTVDSERQRVIDQYSGQDPTSAKEVKLAKEVFVRSEENDRLKDQVKRLQDANREMLETNNRLVQDHKMEIAKMLKQAKSEAARESARLQLAERRLMEREQEVVDVEQRVEYTEMEKMNLLDEISRLKDSLEQQQRMYLKESAGVPSAHTYSLLQKKVADLEKLNKRLEEQLMEQKQQVASLRKKAALPVASPARLPSSMISSSTEDLSSALDRKQIEKKLSDYRTRNKELTNLAKQLDGRLKALKIENESLMESKNRNSTETEKVLRKQFVKQQIKEREDHMKDLRAKDREIEKLKKKLDELAAESASVAKVKAEAKELSSVESNYKTLLQERMQLEMQLAKLLKSTPNDVQEVKLSELVSSKNQLANYQQENGRLSKELAELKEKLSVYTDSDLKLENSMLKQQVRSLQTQLMDQAKVGDEEITELTKQLSAAKEAKDSLELKCSDLLGQVSLLARSSEDADKTVREMSFMRDQVRQLEEDKKKLNATISEVKKKHKALEEEHRKTLKDISKIKELEEMIHLLTEEKAQLEQELNKSREKEEDISAVLEVERKRIIAEVQSKQELESENTKLQSEVVTLRQDLDGTVQSSSKLENLLVDASKKTEELSKKLNEKEEELRDALSKVIHPPKTATKETQCDIVSQHNATVPAQQGPVIPLAPSPTSVTSSGTPSSLPFTEAKSNNLESSVNRKASKPEASSPTKPGPSVPPKTVTSSLSKANTASSKPKISAASTSPTKSRVASLADSFNRKEEPKSDLRQHRSMSVDRPPMVRDSPTGRQNIRGMKTRPKSGGRRSVGAMHWPPTAVPRYITQGGGNLQSELNAMGYEVDDAFDSEAVNITESELDPELFGDDNLEASQSNISLDGVESLTGMDVLGKSQVPQVASTGEGNLASSTSTEGEEGAKTIRQIGPTSGDQIIEVVHPTQNGLSLEDVDSPSPAVASNTSDPADSALPSAVALYKALYDYDPAKQSPNPNPETELPLIIGQLVVVYGGLEEDGFMFGESNGQRGLVPSNFVELIRTLTANEIEKGVINFGGTTIHVRQQLGLQDIIEEEEEARNIIQPPTEVKLERQFIDQTSTDTFKAVISWAAPSLLPNNATGYNIYVNNQFKMAVPVDGERRVLLKELSQQETCSISVRTVTKDTESADPPNLLVIGAIIQPPTEVKLERQFIDQTSTDTFKAVISWTAPSLLPNNATGYNIYVNNQFKMAVPVDGERRVLLKELSQQETCSISVRTVTKDTESGDPPNLLVIGARFPNPPVNLNLQPDLAAKGLLLSWNNGSDGSGKALQPNLFSVYIDNHQATQVEPPSKGTTETEVLLDSKVLETVLSSPRDTHELFVRAVHFNLESKDSESVQITPSMIHTVFEGTNGQGSTQNGTFTKRSGLSLMDFADEEVLGHSVDKMSDHSAGKVESMDKAAVTNLLELAISESDISASASKEDPLSKSLKDKNLVTSLLEVAMATDENDTSEAVSEGFNAEADFVEPLFYRALHEYNPKYMSANRGMEEDELGFVQGDVIKVTSKEDDDWLVGELRGVQGLVPINFVEQIKDPKEVEIHKKAFASLPPVPRKAWVHPVNGESRIAKPKGTARKMRAIYDYDPIKDSPNGPEAAQEELKFTEDDLIIVYGGVDDSGFYTGELKGQIGLIPSNFLEPCDTVSPGANQLGEPVNIAEMSLDSDSNDVSDDDDNESDFEMFAASASVNQKVHGHQISQGIVSR